MTQEIAQQMASWFPLIYLTIFGFIALLWALFLTTLLMGMARTWLGGEKRAPDAQVEPAPRLLRRRVNHRQQGKRLQPRLQPPMMDGTASRHSLPPYSLN